MLEGLSFWHCRRSAFWLSTHEAKIGEINRNNPFLQSADCLLISMALTFLWPDKIKHFFPSFSISYIKGVICRCENLFMRVFGLQRHWEKNLQSSKTQGCSLWAPTVVVALDTDPPVSSGLLQGQPLNRWSEMSSQFNLLSLKLLSKKTVLNPAWALNGLNLCRCRSTACLNTCCLITN